MKTTIVKLEDIINYRNGTDKYSIISVYNTICDIILESSMWKNYTIIWKTELKNAAMNQLIEYLQSPDIGDKYMAIPGSTTEVIIREFVRAVDKMGKCGRYDWLSRVQVGTIMKNTLSGEEYVVVHHNGKYPTVSKTITATNPSEWETVS